MSRLDWRHAKTARQIDEWCAHPRSGSHSYRQDNAKIDASLSLKSSIAPLMAVNSIIANLPGVKVAVQTLQCLNRPE